MCSGLPVFGVNQPCWFPFAFSRCFKVASTGVGQSGGHSRGNGGGHNRGNGGGGERQKGSQAVSVKFFRRQSDMIDQSTVAVDLAEN